MNLKKHITRDDVNDELQKQAAEKVSEASEPTEEDGEALLGSVRLDPDSGQVQAMTGVVDGVPDWTTIATTPDDGTTAVSSSVGHTSVASSSPHHTSSPGLWGSTHPGISWPTPTTGTWPTGTATGGVLKTPTYKSALRKRVVNLPRKFTEKVLLAFLEEEPEDPKKDVVWAANLEVERVEMTLEDGETKLVVVLSLEDKYGNNPDED